MNTDANTLRVWLLSEIRSMLGRQSAVPPLLLWCDPEREWLELLRAVAAPDEFDLGSKQDAPEILIRDVFHGVYNVHSGADVDNDTDRLRRACNLHSD